MCGKSRQPSPSRRPAGIDKRGMAWNHVLLIHTDVPEKKTFRPDTALIQSFLCHPYIGNRYIPFLSILINKCQGKLSCLFF